MLRIRLSPVMRTPVRGAVHSATVVLLVVGLLCCPVGAGSPVSAKVLEINARDQLVSKIIVLRHFYSCPEVTISRDGLLVGEAPVGPWTLHVFVMVEKVEFTDTDVHLRCRRVFNRYDQKAGEFKRLRSNQWIQLKIQRLQEDGEEHFNRVLDRIFLRPGEDLADVVPDYWRMFLLNLDPPEYRPEDMSEPIPPDPKGWDNARYPTNPHYIPEAWAAGVTGQVEVLVRTDPDGTPHVVKILKPLGYGLDDGVVRAIRHWRFKPARRGDQPVTGWFTAKVKFTIEGFQSIS